jgi:hypothetical protein
MGSRAYYSIYLFIYLFYFFILKIYCILEEFITNKSSLPTNGNRRASNDLSKQVQRYLV